MSSCSSTLCSFFVVVVIFKKLLFIWLRWVLVTACEIILAAHGIFKIYLYIHLLLAVVGLHCLHGLPLVAASRGCSLVAMHGLLSAVVSPAPASRAQAQQLWSTGLVVLRLVRSSQTQDPGHIPHTGRWPLNQWPSPGSVQLSSVAQSCPTLCDPMNRSTPGLPVHHQLPEFTQTHIHRVHDAIQPSHPRSSPSPPAPNPSQHQSLFQ